MASHRSARKKGKLRVEFEKTTDVGRESLSVAALAPRLTFSQFLGLKLSRSTKFIKFRNVDRRIVSYLNCAKVGRMLPRENWVVC